MSQQGEISDMNEAQGNAKYTFPYPWDDVIYLYNYMSVSVGVFMVLCRHKRAPKEFTI